MTEPLLAVHDLSVAFQSSGRTTLAVDRVSFDIGKGETVALVGEVRLGQVGYGTVDIETTALPGRAAPLW